MGYCVLLHIHVSQTIHYTGKWKSHVLYYLISSWFPYKWYKHLENVNSLMKKLFNEGKWIWTEKRPKKLKITRWEAWGEVEIKVWSQGTSEESASHSHGVVWPFRILLKPLCDYYLLLSIVSIVYPIKPLWILRSRNHEYWKMNHLSTMFLSKLIRRFKNPPSGSIGRKHGLVCSFVRTWVLIFEWRYV